jgi:aminoglycoside phosphotransferase (APT) family kinase protein
VLQRLAGWIHANVLTEWGGVRLANFERTSGGVSYETWVCDAEDPSAPPGGGVRLVVRREPLRGPLEPYDIAHEAAILRGLAGTGVPVPALLGHCADPEVAGRPFTVLEHVAGEVPDYRTIMERPDWQDEAGRAHMADEFVRVLAELQGVDRARPGFGSALAAPPSERARLHDEIDGMVEVATRRTEGWAPHPIFGHAARWCREHAPDGPPEDMVIVHGDYKVGNFIWRDGRIVALLDWEGATVGDPLQDLGYACHPAMREARPELMAMLAPLDAMVGRFERFTGRAVDPVRLHYYVIHALLFHTWTLLVGIPSIVESDGDMRMATAYSKLNQVTRLLAAQIDAYEEGRGVL